MSTGSLSANDGAIYDATTGMWTVTGTVAQVNTALANLVFVPTATNTLNTTVTISIDDGDEDSSGALLGAMTITVNPLPLVEPPVVDPPVVEIPADEPKAEPPAEEAAVEISAVDLEEPVEGPSLIATGEAPAAGSPVDSTVLVEDSNVRDYDNDNDKVRETTALKPSGINILITKLSEQLEFFDDPLQLIGAESFITRLNDMRDELISETEDTEKVVGVSLSVTAGLSVGYVVWLARSGILLSSVLSSMPAWQFIDPLPVLAGLQGGKRDDDEESLESMVANKDVDEKTLNNAEAGNNDDV